MISAFDKMDTSRNFWEWMAVVEYFLLEAYCNCS